MDKKLDREFGRFDVDLLDSAEYLNMPARARNAAYLYLLVLTGWSRKHRTDGLVTQKVAGELARRMGHTSRYLLKALGDVGMTTTKAGEVTLVKYAKWQQTKEEIETNRLRKQEAGRVGGIQSGVSRASKREAETKQMLPAPTKQTEAEKEREQEKELFIASPNPPGGTGAMKDDPALELGVAMHELLGRQISTVDLIACQAAVNQYAYLTVKELVIRAHDHVDYCRDHTLPTPRTVDGFSDSWRRENDYRSDKGLPKAERVTGGRVTGMTKAFEMAS